MENCEGDKQLAIITGLANLLANEANQTNTIMPVLGYVKKILGAEKICAVVFSAREGAQVFCHKGDSCGDCGEQEAIKQFARRITSISPQPLSGGELMAVLEPEEKRRFKFKDPIFFPIYFEKNIFGALWCDGEGTVNII